MKPQIHASTRLARAFTLASLFGGLSAGSLFAQTSGTWTSTTGGNWSDIANWNSGAGPIATGGSTSTTIANSTATFSGNATQTVNLDSSRTLGSLVFAAGVNTISSTNGSVLTLAATATPVINTTSGGNTTISVKIDGTQGFSFSPGGARSLLLTGNNSYTGVTTLSSGGKIYAGSNNALGASGSGNGTTVTHSNNAAVQLHLYNSITTGEDISMRMTSGNTTTLTAGATLIWTDNGTSTVSNNITLGGVITVDRGSSINTYTDTAGISVGSFSNLIVNGNITGAATTQASNTVADATRLQIATSAATSTATVNGVISDGTITASNGTVGSGANGGLSVYLTGVGRTAFTAANTYTGSTKLNTGTLLVNNPTGPGSGSGTGFGSVTVATGATLGGTGIIAPSGANTITFSSGSFVAPGDLTSAGVAISAGKVLTVDLSNTTGTATFASGATISIDLNGSSPTVAESFAFKGLSDGVADILFNTNTVNFSVSGTALSDGLYTLATFDANNAYSGNWVIGSGLDAYAIKSLVFNANSIQLQIGASSVPEPSTFAMLGGFAALGAAALRRRRR